MTAGRWLGVVVLTVAVASAAMVAVSVFSRPSRAEVSAWLDDGEDRVAAVVGEALGADAVTDWSREDILSVGFPGCEVVTSTRMVVDGSWPEEVAVPLLRDAVTNAGGTFLEPTSGSGSYRSAGGFFDGLGGDDVVVSFIWEGDVLEIVFVSGCYSIGDE